MSFSILKQIGDAQKKKAVVDVRSGDTVKVTQKIKEGSKFRLQTFEGVVIRVDRKESHTARIVVRKVTSGVGKKTAERVIVDLRDKVGIPSHYGATETKFTTVQPANDEALDALIALGFPLKEATAALEKVDLSLSVEERVRLALKG